MSLKLPPAQRADLENAAPTVARSGVGSAIRHGCCWRMARQCGGLSHQAAALAVGRRQARDDDGPGTGCHPSPGRIPASSRGAGCGRSHEGPPWQHRDQEDGGGIILQVMERQRLPEGDQRVTIRGAVIE